jgi:hypothetical protein
MIKSGPARLKKLAVSGRKFMGVGYLGSPVSQNHWISAALFSEYDLPGSGTVF